MINDSKYIMRLTLKCKTGLKIQLKCYKKTEYFNLVSVEDHSLNVYSCGNGNVKHTIIAMARWGDGEMNIGWRPMKAKVEKDNHLIFIDRFGYGLSDDTNREMTAENVVEDYRIALQNMGSFWTVFRKKKRAGFVYDVQNSRFFCSSK